MDYDVFVTPDAKEDLEGFFGRKEKQAGSKECAG
jgi:hypothetical protein